MFAKLRRIEWRHWMFLSLCVVSVLVAIFCYRVSLLRLWEALCDLWQSVLYYARAVGGDPDGAAALPLPVRELSRVDLGAVLPFDADTMRAKWEAFGPALVKPDHFAAYLAATGQILTAVSTLLIPFALLGWILWQRFRARLMRPKTTEPETRALARVKALTRRPLLAWRQFTANTSDFCARCPAWPRILLFIWLCALNIATIPVAALAVYIYFSASFDLLALPVQALKLLIDLCVMFSGLWGPLWVFIAWRILCHIREAIGYAVLEAHEQSNRALITDKLPIVTMIEGTMGAKKTTWITDVALSTAILFRQKALDLMQANDLRFPAFPWAVFRGDLCDAILAHDVYTLVSCEAWIAARRQAYENDPAPEQLWGYDTTRYPVTYNSDLQIVGLWDALLAYAKEFIIYAQQSSLIVANYAVREDYSPMDAGYLPLWDYDLFRRDAAAQGDESAYAHILDMDVMRLGRRMEPDNPLVGSLEYGVILITEIGKERGNAKTTAELKKMIDECNQKNDCMEEYLKMIRHPAVVDNYVFVRVYCDDQRAMSWGADGRQLCTIVYIEKCSPAKTALPFFYFAEALYDFFRPRFDAFYTEYCASRGDMCLPMAALKGLFAWFFARHDRACNRFGYYVQTLTTERGDEHGTPERYPYYLAKKKIYANRFSTDCHKGLFARRARKCAYGLNDYPTFAGTLATDEELDKMHSHFIRNARAFFDDAEK